MRQPVSFLSQSRFHSPAFNAAIFDGPMRIYFAQYQESVALKVYFTTQQRFKELFVELREGFRKSGINIFLMIYPSEEAFRISFTESSTEAVVVDRLGHDFVIGVPASVIDSSLEVICEKVKDISETIRKLIPQSNLEKLNSPVTA